MMGLVVLLVTSSLTASAVDGYPNGAPAAACVDLKPGHNSTESVNPFNYEFVIEKNVITTSENLTVTLRGKGNALFRGFIVMAFEENDLTKPIGMFDLPLSSVEAKTLDCPDFGEQAAAVTHTNSTQKQSVGFVWIPPNDFQGNALFLATVVRTKALNWDRRPSPVVRVIPDGATLSPSTTRRTTTAVSGATTGVPLSPTSSASSATNELPSTNTFSSATRGSTTAREPTTRGTTLSRLTTKLSTTTKAPSTTMGASSLFTTFKFVATLTFMVTFFGRNRSVVWIQNYNYCI